MIKTQLRPYVAILGLLTLCSCNFCFITHPSCLLAPQATTNVKRNKYYKRDFTKTDTILSTHYVYELVDTLINAGSKYRYQSFLFYDNGLVLREEYYTNSLITDTLRTFTQDLITACCHGSSIGSYVVHNDTVYYGTKFGYTKDWDYYKAKITDGALMIFETNRGKVKETDIKRYVKNKNRVVLKTIKI